MVASLNQSLPFHLGSWFSNDLLCPQSLSSQMVASTSKAGIQPARKTTVLVTAVPRTSDKQWHITDCFNLHSTKNAWSSIARPCSSAANKPQSFSFFFLSDGVKAENSDVLFKQETYLMLCLESWVHLCKQEFNNILSLMSNTHLFFFRREA